MKRPQSYEEQSHILLEHLDKLNNKAEELEGNGAVLVSAEKGYLSFNPYMTSSDINRAFCFKNLKQANKIREAFAILYHFRAVKQ